MKRNVVIAIIFLLVSFAFFACAPVAHSDQTSEDSNIAENGASTEVPGYRNDQRYFYNWEKFSNVDELNKKLAEHLEWSNNKIMRTLGNKSPVQLLQEKLAAA